MFSSKCQNNSVKCNLLQPSPNCDQHDHIAQVSSNPANTIKCIRTKPLSDSEQESFNLPPVLLRILRPPPSEPDCWLLRSPNFNCTNEFGAKWPSISKQTIKNPPPKSHAPPQSSSSASHSPCPRPPQRPHRQLNPSPPPPPPPPPPTPPPLPLSPPRLHFPAKPIPPHGWGCLLGRPPSNPLGGWIRQPGKQWTLGGGSGQALGHFGAEGTGAREQFDLLGPAASSGLP